MVIAGVRFCVASLSSWRAWIEIRSDRKTFERFESLSSWRAWIEIPTSARASTALWCRSPHGERGLKWKRLEHAGNVRVALLMESVD